MGRDNVVTRFKVMHPKRVADWNTDESKIQWFQNGVARQDDNGVVIVNINSVPLGEWDGTLRLVPLDDDNYIDDRDPRDQREPRVTNIN